MSTSKIPDLYESHVKILKIAGQNEAGARMTEFEDALAPVPAHETVSFLLDLKLIEEAVNRDGVKQRNRFSLTDLGENIAEQYATGKRKAKPDPKEHAKVTPPGATKETAKKPPAKGKAKPKATAASVDDEG